MATQTIRDLLNVGRDDFRLPGAWSRRQRYNHVVGKLMPYAVTTKLVKGRAFEPLLFGHNLVGVGAEDEPVIITEDDINEPSDPNGVVYNFQDPHQHTLELQRNGEIIRWIWYRVEIQIPLFEVLKLSSSVTIDADQWTIYFTEDGRDFTQRSIDQQPERLGLGRFDDGRRFIWRHMDSSMNVQQFESRMQRRVWDFVNLGILPEGTWMIDPPVERTIDDDDDSSTSSDTLVPELSEAMSDATDDASVADEEEEEEEEEEEPYPLGPLRATERAIRRSAYWIE